MAELETKNQLASMDSLYCLAQPSLNLYIHCFRIFWSLGHPLTRFEEKIGGSLGSGFLEAVPGGQLIFGLYFSHLWVDT